MCEIRRGSLEIWFAIGGRVEELLYRNGSGIYYIVGSLDGKDSNTIDACMFALWNVDRSCDY